MMKSMEWVFSKIRIEELDTVLDLFKSTAEKIQKKGVDHWQYWHDPPPAKIQWVQEGITNQEFYFVNNEKGENIGMVRIMDEDLLYWGEVDGKSKFVHSLVVREEYNGKGIGATILQAIETQAREENCEFIRLDCDSKNPRLCQFYENLNFQKVGTSELPLSTYNLYQKEL